MPSGMNARPRSPRRSRSPPSAREPGMREEGDRSAVACTARITTLNISFISGPSNYRIPRTCGARKGRPRSRLRTRALHPAVVAAAITRGAAPSAVNETHPRSCAFFHLFPFFALFLFLFLFRRPPSGFASSPAPFLPLRRFPLNRRILTFRTSMEIAA